MEVVFFISIDLFICRISKPHSRMTPARAVLQRTGPTFKILLGKNLRLNFLFQEEYGLKSISPLSAMKYESRVN